LVKAVREAGLEHRVIGVDDPRIATWLAGAGLRAKFVPAEHIFCDIRRVKTPAEIGLLRIAARINEEACLAASSLLRDGLDWDGVENAYMVEKAQRDAAAKLRPGSTMGEADLAARQAITAAGYPEFDYGVGHGVGLAIHEAPWLRANSEEILETDMITTIEPGIYLGVAGGIRIENIYRITPQGSERLGDLPATLESMVLV
jgi:Xaa-Pro aminopeptidase